MANMTAAEQRLERITTRRRQVAELQALGLSQRAIARRLKVPQSTVADDQVALRSGRYDA